MIWIMAMRTPLAALTQRLTAMRRGAARHDDLM
jgi:hypothetical protein